MSAQHALPRPDEPTDEEWRAAYPDGPQCRTFSDDGQRSLCDRPARYVVWGHLYPKAHKGPKCPAHAVAGGAVYPIPAPRRTS